MHPVIANIVKLLLDDRELVGRLLKGDIESFELIYEKYSGRLYYFGLKYLKDTFEAEDLVQSVFLKVWENRKELKIEASFKSFLFTIAYNDICKLFRRRKYLNDFINKTLLENPQISSDTEEIMSYRSILNRVQQIIDKLPAKQKSVFLKSKIEGKSAKEIGKEIKLSPGTVDNYISETIKVIREYLKVEIS